MRMQIKMNVSFIFTLSRTFIATIANFVNVYNDAIFKPLSFVLTLLFYECLFCLCVVMWLPYLGWNLGVSNKPWPCNSLFQTTFHGRPATQIRAQTHLILTQLTPPPSIPSNTNPSFSQIIYKFKAWPADRPGWAKAMKLWITLSTIQIMKMEQAVLCFVMLSTCNSNKYLFLKINNS